MTDPNLVPPKDLVDKWVDMLSTHNDQQVFTEIAQWGSNIELDACCEWLDREGWSGESRQLRAARRPKPPSLRQRALEALELVESDLGMGEETDTIRRALEQLDD